MKKNLIKILAFVLIFLHIVPPNSISYAVEELNNCENTGFNIQTITIDTDKITGTSDPSQQLKIEFKRQNKTENISVDSNGNYEVEIEEDFLEINDEISIKNKYHQIETKVVSDDVETTIIESVQYAECIEIDEVEKEQVGEELEESQDENEEIIDENETEKLSKEKETEDISEDLNINEKIVEETEIETIDNSLEDTINDDMTSEKSLQKKLETDFEDDERITDNQDDIKNELEKCESINEKVKTCSELNPTLEDSNKESISTRAAQSYVFELKVEVQVTDTQIISTGNVSGYNGNPGNIWIKIWDEKLNTYCSDNKNCRVDDNGNFKFILDLKEFKGENLYFQAYQGDEQSGRKSKLVGIIVQKPTFKLDIPSSIQFEDTMISNKEVTINRKEDLVVSVTDTRLNDKWRLSVKASPLSNGSHTIDNAIYFVNEKDNLLSEDEEVPVATGDSGKNIQEFRWAKNQGILLKLNPLQAQANTPYQSTITWTLADGP